jgi:hypothetical protein
MSLRLVVAYLLILLLACGGIGVAWRLIYNSPRQRMRRYYRAKRDRRES